MARAPESLDQPVIMTSPHSLVWYHLWFHRFLSLAIMIMVSACSLLPDLHLLGLAARALLVSLGPVDKVVEATGIYIGLEPWVFLDSCFLS